MTVSDAFKFLYDYFSACAVNKADFVTVLVRAALSPDKVYDFPFFDSPTKKLNNIFNGGGQISKKDAQYIIDNVSLTGFGRFFESNLPSSPDRIDELESTLTDLGFEVDGDDSTIARHCVDIFIGALKERIHQGVTSPEPDSTPQDDNSEKQATEENSQLTLHDALSKRTVELGQVLYDAFSRVDRAMALELTSKKPSNERPNPDPSSVTEEMHQQNQMANTGRTTNLTQTGDNNLYVEQNNGVINVVSTKISPQPTASDLLAIRNFSQEYYQLIVTGDEIFDESAIVIPVDRALVKGSVPDEIYDTCSSLSPDGQEIMKKIPAIICNENTKYHGQTDPDQSAIYARIEKIKVGSGGIKIYYKPLDLFPQHIMNENNIDFGIRCDAAITELNRCAWSVKKINLFEAFEDVGLDNIRSPK